MITFKDQVITVRRPVAWIEDRGNLVPDWSTAVEHTIAGCRLQPMATEEAHFSGSSTGGVARDAVVTRWRVFGPEDPDLTPYDRVVYNGETHEVDGQVQDWGSPTGLLAHSEAVLRRVDG